MDLRRALNAVSDVVANRPPAIREFDQIYMKHADLLLQTELIAKWFKDRRVAFIGDGDAIGLCLAYLSSLGEIDDSPKEVLVLDFDERVVNSVTAFAERYKIQNLISAQLYNVADKLPEYMVGNFDAFYTNPPFGAQNDGRSVHAFVRRGLEACKPSSVGCIVLADSAQDNSWARKVLNGVEKYALEEACVIRELVPHLHTYHLDDDPGLTSCSMIIERIGLERFDTRVSKELSEDERQNFYGAGKHLQVRYVRDKRKISESGIPVSSEYTIETLASNNKIH